MVLIDVFIRIELIQSSWDSRRAHISIFVVAIMRYILTFLMRCTCCLKECFIQEGIKTFSCFLAIDYNSSNYDWVKVLLLSGFHVPKMINSVFVVIHLQMIHAHQVFLFYPLFLLQCVLPVCPFGWRFGWKLGYMHIPKLWCQWFVLKLQIQYWHSS